MNKEQMDKLKRIAINKQIVVDVLKVKLELDEFFKLFTNEYKRELRVLKSIQIKNTDFKTNGEIYIEECNIEFIQKKIKNAEKQRIEFLKDEIHLIKLRLDSDYKRQFKNKSRIVSNAIQQNQQQQKKIGSKLKHRTKKQALDSKYKLKYKPSFAKPKGL